MNPDPNAANAAAASSAVAVVMFVYLAFTILMLAGLWRTFSKAGRPGWAAIIPIYNVIVLIQVSGKPVWCVLLFFIPFVNVIMYILVLVALATNFGKGAGYAVGLLVLPFIFHPMLGFGDAKYSAAPPPLK
jgi:hypothetical protein